MMLRKTARDRIALRPTSRSRRTLQVAAATAGFAMTATSVPAAIVATAPDVLLIAPPASVVQGALESNMRIFAFNERQCFPLPADLDTDQGLIHAGTKVSCHLLHTDPAQPPIVLTGKARFNALILGVVNDSADLDASDGPCKWQNTVYPAAGTEPFRGLEPAQPNDQYNIIQGGFGIQVRMDVPSFLDQVRVITRCD